MRQDVSDGHFTASLVRRTDHRGLGHPRMHLQDPLDLAGKDVFPADNDDVLLPAGDRQETVGVDPADVAGVEPAAFVYRSARCISFL